MKNGYTEIKRLNVHTTLYAEAVREVGRETGTVVVDLWSAFMEKAGWKAGDEDIMPGTRITGLSEVLNGLLIDGMIFFVFLLCRFLETRMDHHADKTGNLKAYILLLLDTKSYMKR